MPENLSKRSGAGVALLVLSAIGLLIALILFLRYQAKKKITNQTSEETPNDKLNNPTEPDEFLKIVRSIVSDETTAKILTAQAMHETGIFSDDKYQDANNAFGMKYPKERETLATGETPNGYAIYDNIEDSIKDLLLWFEAKELPPVYGDVMVYCQQIREKGYYTAPFLLYASSVKKHFNTLL